MKRIALLLVCTSMVVLGAGPAAAKDRVYRTRLSAYVSGPGLGAPIVLKGHDASSLYYLTMQAGCTQQGINPAASDRLGTRYEVLYFARTPEDQIYVVRQVLYPFARAAVWAWTPPGQRFAGGYCGSVDVQSGWWHSVALRDKLVGWGLAAPPHEIATAAGSKKRGSLIWVWFWMGVLLASVGLTRFAIARRRRPIPTPSATPR